MGNTGIEEVAVGGALTAMNSSIVCSRPSSSTVKSFAARSLTGFPTLSCTTTLTSTSREETLSIGVCVVLAPDCLFACPAVGCPARYPVPAANKIKQVSPSISPPMAVSPEADPPTAEVYHQRQSTKPRISGLSQATAV